MFICRYECETWRVAKGIGNLSYGLPNLFQRVRIIIHVYRYSLWILLLCYKSLMFELWHSTLKKCFMFLPVDKQSSHKFYGKQKRRRQIGIAG